MLPKRMRKATTERTVLRVMTSVLLLEASELFRLAVFTPPVLVVGAMFEFVGKRSPPGVEVLSFTPPLGLEMSLSGVAKELGWSSGTVGIALEPGMATTGAGS
jgi:hypothetical protein